MKETHKKQRGCNEEHTNIQRYECLSGLRSEIQLDLKLFNFQLSFNGKPELPRRNYCQRHHTWTLLRASLIPIAIHVSHVYKVCVLMSALNSRDKETDKIQSCKKVAFFFLIVRQHSFVSLCFKNLLSTNIMKKVKEVVLCLLNIFH